MKMVFAGICFASVFLMAESAAAYDPPDGFRQVPWGTDIATVQNEMVRPETHGDTKCYSRKKDNLSVGEAKVSAINYCFYKGRFFMVTIDFTGIANYVPIKQTLFEKFGTGYQNNQFMQSYYWGLGSSPVVIHLEYSEVSQEGSIVYRQREIADQEAEDLRQKSKNAGKDL